LQKNKQNILGFYYAFLECIILMIIIFVMIMIMFWCIMIIAFSNVAYYKLRDSHFACINPKSYKSFLNFEVKLGNISLITNECDRTIDRYKNSPFFSKDLTHIIFNILVVPIICSIACGIVPIYIIKNQTICGPSCWF
jgi:ABC-type sugar transport system permease subunit